MAGFGFVFHALHSLRENRRNLKGVRYKKRNRITLQHNDSHIELPHASPEQLDRIRKKMQRETSNKFLITGLIITMIVTSLFLFLVLH